MLLLVLEGGGMRAGFVAGALMALMDKRLTGFDAALAVSASVPTLAYFAAGQREAIERVWRDELNTPNLVCYRNIPAASIAPSVKRPILNIDYLVYEVFKEKFPLDLKTLLANRMVCRFAATSVPDGELVLLHPDWDDIYILFKACLAVPGCYPGCVSLDLGDYVDGGTAHPLPVRAMLNPLTDRIVVILSKPLDWGATPPNMMERALFWRYFRKYDWMIDRICHAAQAYAAEVSFLEERAQMDPPMALIIAPERMPPVKFITRDRAKINRTIDMGYRTVETLESRIRDFMTVKTSIPMDTFPMDSVTNFYTS
jgi:predicted patatin/cPLA2 family phospholipase